MTKIRIATAVKKRYPQLSQKQIKKLLEDNKIIVNSRVIKKNSWVNCDAKVEIEKMPLSQLASNLSVNCKLIKKTKDYIFFSKGPLVHSIALNFEETHSASNWLIGVDESLRKVSHPLESGLLHRLDFETSGIMVSARNNKSFECLKDKFKNQQVYKEYVCLVSKGGLKPSVYTAYAGQKSKTSKKIIVQEYQNLGANQFKQITTQILSSTNIKNSQYKVVVKLITGFRHQIRAHLAFLGFPIVGDVLYGGEKSDRLFLHAQKIAFDLENGQKIEAESPFF